MNIKELKTFFIILIGGLLLSACGFSFNPGSIPNQIMPGIGRWLSGFDSNGERIYFTGTNENGKFIDYSGGSAFGGMMMNSQLSCAACHGTDGRGGLHRMHMTVMDAPDIRLEALSGEIDEHSDSSDDEHDDDHVDVHEGYDLETFKMAVVFGEHPDGKPLDNDMPRWELSDQDLADLFEFIATLE